MWSALPERCRPNRIGAADLAPVVRAALDDGWTPRALARQVSERWPSEVASLTGLLRHRLTRDLPAAPSQARPRGAVVNDASRPAPPSPAERMTVEQVAASLGACRHEAGRLALARRLVGRHGDDVDRYLTGRFPELEDGQDEGAAPAIDWESLLSGVDA